MTELTNFFEMFSSALEQPLMRDQSLVIRLSVGENGITVSSTSDLAENFLSLIASVLLPLGDTFSDESAEESLAPIASKPHDHVECLQQYWTDQGMKPRKIIGHPDLIHPYHTFLGDWCYVSVPDAILLESAGYNVEIHMRPDEKDNLAVQNLKDAVDSQKDSAPDGWWNTNSAQTTN